MFREVKELQSKGFKLTAISKKPGIDRLTETKYCKEILPARNRKLRNQHYRYDKYVEQECAKGRPIRSVFEEIKSQGFSGSPTPFYDHDKYLLEGPVKDARGRSLPRRIALRATDLNWFLPRL